MYYLVLNNEFNRRYYPSLIGLRFLNPPIHACASASYRPVQVRKLPVRKDRKLTVQEDGGEVEVERTTKTAQNAELKFMDDEIRPIG